MDILPKPKQMSLLEGNFELSHRTGIIVDSGCSFGDFESAVLLQKEIKSVSKLHISIAKAFKKEDKACIYLKLEPEKYGREAYKLEIKPDAVEITAGESSGLFYGIQTLRQIIRLNGARLPCMTVNDSPHFENRGYFYDITRGKMPTLDCLKEIVDRISFYKINQFQLYIEHTFAFKKFSEAWIKSDPVTAEEILELDRYCREKHVELVPCIATFSHMYDIMDTNSYRELSELDRSVGRPFTWYNRLRYHMLDASNPKSIEFVKDMLNEFIPLFTSDKFNICCDETFDLGMGKSKELADKIGKGQVYVDFTNKIIEHVKSLNKKVMFWGDIVLNYPDLIPQIPKDVVFLNWYYYRNAKEENVSIFTELGFKQYVCPSVSGFSRMVNQLDMSFDNIAEMIKFGKKHGAIGVLNTDWGDDGCTNFLASGIPGMIYGAALSWNPDDDENYEGIDRKISILEFGEKGGRLVGLLRQLCRQDIIIWNFIVFWKNEKLYNMVINQGCKVEFDKYGEKTLFDAAKKANELAGDILQVSTGVPERCSVDMEEFYLSARGVALVQALSLIIKKFDYKEEISDLPCNPWEMAEMLEYWFYDFAGVWRKRSKEGELYRLREAIVQICDILRNY